MNNFDYFFRGVPDGKLNIPDFLIIINLAILFLIFLYVRNSNQKNEKLLYFGAIAQIIQQSLLFYWYFFHTNVYWSQGLPLYHCRIAMVVLVFCILFKKEDSKIALFLSYIGFAGSIAAIAMPDMDKFLFPHITNFSYVLGHFILFLNSSIIIKNSNSKLSFKDIISITLIMHILIKTVNYLTYANYGFLTRPPSFMKTKFSSFTLFAIVTLIMIVFAYVMDILNKKGKLFGKNIKKIKRIKLKKYKR